MLENVQLTTYSSKGPFRNPIQVKTFLRPLRVALGPSSILTSVYMGSVQILSELSILWRYQGKLKIEMNILLRFSFILTRFSGGIQRENFMCSWLLVMLSLTVLSFSCLAGFVLRPDNNEVIDALKIKTTFNTRAVHGYLNNLSLISSIFIIIVHHHTKTE